MKTDILIVGSGCAGLYCALSLPRDKKITIITKSDVESCDSFLAQGGICVLKDAQDYEAFFEDTLRAGHYENDKTSVEIMIRSSRDVINELISYGVDFQKDAKGNLSYTKEGAHSEKRILFHEDITGREITSKLLAAVRKLSNVTILEHTTLLDIIERDNRDMTRAISPLKRFFNGRMSLLRRWKLILPFLPREVLVDYISIPQISDI